MERHDSQLTARFKRAFGGLKPFDQLAKFVIHPNPDRLERPRGGVGLVRFRARQAFLDHRHELFCRGQRPRGHNRAGDFARRALLAVMVENICDLALIGAVQQIGSGRARVAHPHIKRPFAHEREAALGLIELHRGDAEIEHDPVQPCGINRMGIAIHFGEGALLLDQAVAILIAPSFCHLEHARITIDPDHPIRAMLADLADYVVARIN